MSGRTTRTVSGREPGYQYLSLVQRDRGQQASAGHPGCRWAGRRTLRAASPSGTWASNDDGDGDPIVALPYAGDMPTREMLAAV